MSEQIPEAVRKETARCGHDFSCVTSGKCGGREMCPVEYARGKNVLFLTDRQGLSCPYRLPFGDRQVCRCPTHYALHTCDE